MEDERPSLHSPGYEGEDLSPTTEKELRGFYAYGLAAEVFAVCGVGSFLPVTLEQLARERGVWWSDKTTSCMAKTAVENGTTIASTLLQRAIQEKNSQCVVRIFNMELTTSSFAMYSFSLATLIQALTLITFSSVADYGTYRKRFLLGFGFTGAVASMLFIFVIPPIFLIGTLLVIIGVTCLGSSFVMLNSFLPLLVKNHPQAYSDRSDIHNSDHLPMESLSPESTRSTENFRENMGSAFSDKYRSSSLDLKLSTTISSIGVGIGYAAGVFVQLLSILLLYLMSKTSVSSTLPLRMVLFMVGLWWLLFTIPALLWLRSRPGRPLNTNHGKSGWRSAIKYATFAWSSLWRTIKMAARLRQVVIFLVAWFLLSDAVATVSGTAILFARTELHMGTVAVALLSIIATSSGIAGAFIWPLISRRFNLETNGTIVACLILMEIIPLYGLLGFIPFIKAWGVGGLQQSWEIYPLGIVHGFVMSGLSSHCRSFFGALIPNGSESAFFALYAITDKGSSAVGPAIVGRIVDATGTIRPAFIFLAVLIALPCPLIWMVDVEKGRTDAITMAMAMSMEKSDIQENLERENEQFDEAEGLMNDHD